MNALLNDDDPDAFVEGVRNNAPDQTERWHTCLKNPVTLIGNLHLVLDVDFIFGGHLAEYFTEDDIQFLYGEIRNPLIYPDFLRDIELTANRKDNL